MEVNVKYFTEAQDIWRKFVPEKGQSNVVEGELIRAIEKLRTEAYDNGNANWDIAFAYFCDYIWEKLNDSTTFSLNEIKEIRSDLDRILEYKEPYLEDDLYDRIADYVIVWSKVHNGPIPREHDPQQYR